MTVLYVITSNHGKFSEIEKHVGSLGISVIQNDFGYPEIQADTLEDVARFGVDWVQRQFPYAFILEDSGLFIDAFQGFPGVYSKYVFFTIGLPGVLKLLDDRKVHQRTAVFRSVIAFGEPGKKPVLFIGECKGKISKTLRGTNGFGYDPIFIPDGETKTFAQMTIHEKNLCSHRGKSVEKFIDFLQKKGKKKKNI